MKHGKEKTDNECTIAKICVAFYFLFVENPGEVKAEPKTFSITVQFVKAIKSIKAMLNGVVLIAVYLPTMVKERFLSRLYIAGLLTEPFVFDT